MTDTDSARAIRWLAPDLDPATAPPVAATQAESNPMLPSVEELQALERAAREEGYANGHAAGHAEGLASGQSEVRRMVAQMEGILDGFTRPLARLDNEVADALGELAVRIAGNLLGRTYQADPTLLADLVREALDAVGASSREIELRLHPDDLGVLAPHLMGLSGVRLSEDSGLARGELRLHSESVRIDGTLAARLQACLDAAMDADASADTNTDANLEITP
ncbi:flagellar assembly protein FliH [Lysobacter sp. CW239]|uniref:FliH/SctL family protein n=1 Tax=Lysobacteraceae TaxID=32033 RepID=UPI00068FB425|nr:MULTISPECIES: FliH/SctL family protein [Lysobacter]QOD90599.1 flagellar assembly protein FliH [Lysobacter sp. CW239]